MVPVRTGDDDTSEAASEAATRPLTPSRLRFGALLTAVGVGASAAWIGWRASTLPIHPVGIAVFAIEVIGLLCSIAISMGLIRAQHPRAHFADDPRESRRFAFAVADIVGRTRSTDLHLEVRQVARRIVEPESRRSADAAIAAVVLEGPRRLALVVALTAGLLLGESPFPLPTLPVAAAFVVGTVTFSFAHVVLAGGRLRFGDRLRWSYSSIGEVISARDVDGVAPRRWVGTVATVAALCLAIGLRGMSDRWTHGLAPMPDRERTIAMLLAIVAVAGALFTLRTMQAPALADDPLRSRRLEERTARQSAIGATVLVGLVGLLAGVLPGGVDAADDDPVGVVQTVEFDRRTPGG